MAHQRHFEGEWWILADGTSVYADSADGMSHEDVVMQEVFGAYRNPKTPEDQPDEDNWMDWGIPLSGPDKDALRDRGMPEDTITFFSKRNADARDYGTQVLGWIRAKANAFNMREFDDDALRRIQRFDGWVDGAEVMDGTVDLYEEDAHTVTWEARVPVRVLLKAESAAALKRYMAPDGVGRWRENPYRNFHAARQTPKSAKRYVDYKWVNAAWHDGPDRPITVNYGVRHTWGPRQGRMEVHTVAFPAAIWTEAEARAWLKAHGLKDDHFEAATG